MISLKLFMLSRISPNATINGTVKGELNNAKLVNIKPCGNYIGSIKAKVLHVAGSFVGSIDVDTLVVHSTGRIYYDMAKARKVYIYHDGLYIDKDRDTELNSDSDELIKQSIFQTNDKINTLSIKGKEEIISETVQVVSEYRGKEYKVDNKNNMPKFVNSF